MAFAVHPKKTRYTEKKGGSTANKDTASEQRGGVDLFVWAHKGPQFFFQPQPTQNSGDIPFFVVGGFAAKMRGSTAKEGRGVTVRISFTSEFPCNLRVWICLSGHMRVPNFFFSLSRPKIVE